MTLPLSQRRASARRAARETERGIAESLRELREQEEQRQAEVSARRAAAKAAEKARPKLTADDVTGARFVRDEFGWHKVVRVSAKSVTVETPWSWTDRILLAKVLEVRS